MSVPRKDPQPIVAWVLTVPKRSLVCNFRVAIRAQSPHCSRSYAPAYNHACETHNGSSSRGRAHHDRQLRHRRLSCPGGLHGGHRASGTLLHQEAEESGGLFPRRAIRPLVGGWHLRFGLRPLRDLVHGCALVDVLSRSPLRDGRSSSFPSWRSWSPISSYRSWRG